MSKKVLYLGDSDLKGAASYLAGVMAHYNIEFDYLPSAAPMTDEILDQDYRVVIISDYPSSNFTDTQLHKLTKKVESGMGLAMFGGWASYVGSSGGYQQTALANVLPVTMKESDDRINCSSPCVVYKTRNHQIVASLPLSSDLPGIGGFNEFRAKDAAITVLATQMFEMGRDGNGELVCVRKDNHPLLVVGSHGKGNITCFASDVAPHWVGGLVDWGGVRIEATAEGANTIEVGNFYAELFNNILSWTGNF